MGGTEHVAMRQFLAFLRYDGPGSEMLLKSHDENQVNSMLTDGEWTRRLVVWLEDTTIRHWTVENRVGMKSTDIDVWTKSIESYLKELHCPIDVSIKREHNCLSEEVLTWLLGHAVGLLYEDNAVTNEQTLKAIMDHHPPPENWSRSDLPVMDDFEDEETRAVFKKLCEELRVPLQEEEVETLRQCLYRIENDILPVLKGKQSNNLPAMESEEDIERLVPLGFETGDRAVDMAARVLRTLYIRDLRQLQNQIDDAISQQQELTANPRTDTSRGKSKRSR